MQKPVSAWRATLLSLIILTCFLGTWELALQGAGQGGGAAIDPEYAALLGQAAASGGQTPMPKPSEIGRRLFELLSDPFYIRGPNDQGIGIQVAYPLAWMPLALFTIQDSSISAVFVIFICSIWPMLLNTAFGVSAVRREWLNVARTLEAGTWRTAFRVILPAAAPTILTGMRISIGIAWLVIVAAEMLVGGTGIGYWVWTQWNNLSIADICIAILMIGLVGLALDRLLGLLARAVAWQE